jgi:hypothetical protein
MRWVVLGFWIAACGDDAVASRDAGRDAIAVDAGARCRSDVQCSNGAFCDGVERCDPAAPSAGADGCLPAANPACLSGQTCDETAGRCATMCELDPDADMDGATSVDCGGMDCDDADPNRHPDGEEVCDPAGHDEDCDLATFGLRDDDEDGFADSACCNGEGVDRACGGDCNDARASANPDSAEVCNGFDDDCDTRVDEGVLRSFVIDADGDSFGSAAAGAPTIEACFRRVGYAHEAGDCNDADVSIHPGALELCDSGAPAIDEDCDGIANPPALCDCTDGSTRPCAAPGICAAGIERCTGGRWGACSIAAVGEACNMLDDDCNGTADDGVTVSCYVDGDDDGYAASGAAASEDCPDSSRLFAGGCPAGKTDRAPFGADLDCNDAAAGIRPGTIEVCDGVDQDCDATIDEAVSITCYADGDGDTFAAIGAVAERECPVAGRGFVGGCPVASTNRRPLDGADCNDATASIHPLAAEVCEGATDEDCDATVDEGCSCVNGTTRPCPLPGVCAAGLETCGGGAWGACSIAPVAEVCNALDDDCDGAGPDETFACVSGATGACAVCGRAGTQVCALDCSGYGPCRAATEACNACDDDADGATDEGFRCPSGGVIDPCTTSCGTPGAGTCNAACDGAVPGTCFAAAETCNYCDDDGDGSVAAERPLATVARTTVPECASLDRFSTIGCALTGPPSHEEVHLLSAATTNDVASAWIATPQGVGWGPMDFAVSMRVNRGGSVLPGDGWALVLSDSGTATLGPIGSGLSVPYSRTGLAIEWRFYQDDFTVDQPDRVTVRRLTGAGTGTILAVADVPDLAMHLDATSAGDVFQSLYVRYAPRDVSDGNESLEVATAPLGSTPALVFLWGGPGAPPGATTILDHELTSGRPMDAGVTAASGGRTSDVFWRIGAGTPDRSPFTWTNVCF